MQFIQNSKSWNSFSYFFHAKLNYENKKQDIKGKKFVLKNCNFAQNPGVSNFLCMPLIGPLIL